MISTQKILFSILFCFVYICSYFAMGCDSSSGSSQSGGGIIITTPCTGEAGSVYVSTLGNDNNPGTRDEPKLTIQAGIDCADYLFLSGDVRVDEGTYIVDGEVSSLFQETMGVVMKEGISLYGGYSSGDWDQRDPATHVSTIRDSSIGDSGLVQYPGRAVHCKNITSGTVIEGFTIQGGHGEYNSAIALNDASPVIRNCVIYGGYEGSMCYGIHVYNGSPEIYDNVINGGSGAVYTNGISSSYSSSWIHDNDINGGSGSTGSYGIEEYYASSIIGRNFINSGTSTGARKGIKLTGSEAFIYNNVITTTSSTVQVSTGISIDTTQNSEPVAYIINNSVDVGDAEMKIIGISITTAHPEIINNILFSPGSDAFTQYGIYETDSHSDPTSVKNNDIVNFDGGGVLSTGFYRDNQSTYTLDTLSGGNYTNSHAQTLTTPAGINNISVDPELDMDSLSLTGSSPTAVTTGGQDCSTFFSDDYTGSLRSAPWSIGAYE